MKSGMREKVSGMLDIISNRGEYGRKIIETKNSTLGIIWSKFENNLFVENKVQDTFRIGPSEGHQVSIEIDGDNLLIKRGKYGIVPAYIAEDKDDTIIFGSEIKSLIPESKKLIEFLPGQQFLNGNITTYFQMTEGDETNENENQIAQNLQQLLTEAISKRNRTTEAGVWLSGGLDSSIVTGLLKKKLGKLHSFTAGMKNSSDLTKASEIASFFKTEHHEIILDKKMMLNILPDVIFHLETFDVQLVRSGIISMCSAWASSDYVNEIYTGDAADELFAGFDFLKVFPASEINKELISLIKKMPSTSLQRTDRSSAAFGLSSNIIFADPSIVEYAMSIPGKFKIKDGIEKWILRFAFGDLLPDEIRQRPKNKIWQGSGIESVLSEYARSTITDFDFSIERQLPNGWYLSNKEQLLYYRIFREHFGEFSDLRWMGIS